MFSFVKRRRHKMAQNRVGLTFEALIHENKKRPNNRLEKLLDQQLYILESMRGESERLYRKQYMDLVGRKEVYNRILGEAVTKVRPNQI